MFSGKFDESYDKDRRAFVVAGYFGRSDEWLTLHWKWSDALEHYGLTYFKASECELGQGEFLKYRDNPSDPTAPLSSQEKARLTDVKTKFVDIANSCNLWGIGATVLTEHFDAVLSENPRALDILTKHPYFLCFQAVMAEVGSVVNEVNRKVNLPRGGRAELVGFVFDAQEELSGRAKQLYDGFQKRNPISSQCMASLAYADDQKLIGLQAADNYAYEVMKFILNSRYDQGRIERKAMTRLKEKTYKIYAFDKPSLQLVVKTSLDRVSIEAASLDQHDVEPI